MHTFPFRLGATSYVIPDNLAPNVRYLAGQATDVELVLIDLEDGTSNLPSTAEVDELGALAAVRGLAGWRDYQSLAYMPGAQVLAVIELLVEAPFGGVLTREFVAEADFRSSLSAPEAALAAVESATWRVR
jgi:hypothetical protein